MFKGENPGHRSRYIIASLCCIALMMTACSDGSAPQDPNLPPLPQNSAPSAVISSVPDTVERTTITVDGSGSTDPDGSISAYAWSLTNPSDFDISLTISDEPTTEIEIGEIADDVTLELSLTVMDNQGASASTSTTVFVEEIDFDLLPPFPGRQSLATVEGIDSDSDGVRDEVEIALYGIYELETPIRELSQIGASALQLAVLAGASNDTDLAGTASIQMSKFIACLSFLEGVNKSRAIFMVEGTAANSQDRSNAMISYNDLLIGRTSTIPSVSRSDCGIIE